MNLLDPRSLSAERWRYVVRGITRRFWQIAQCPSCKSARTTKIDQKLSYSLRSCEQCKLLFRYPYETSAEMDAFYQDSYDEAGLTTELPDDQQLAQLIATNFRGSDKDFSHLPLWLEALNVHAESQVLDYGANWGYCAYQLQQAGYKNVTSYEIARSRAKFGLKLGVEIRTSLSAAPGTFDVVYSSHVLEHVPDPLDTIREQIRLVRPGGYVIARTPNGCGELRKADPSLAHSRWGRVHPVLLNDAFLLQNFGEKAIYMASKITPQGLREWNGNGLMRGPLTEDELCFVIKV